MAVTHRATGTWTELTADGAVGIPAGATAGDRMFLFAAWKDFSITAQVAGWTEITEFADGAVAQGNGTGSMKVGCWYKDHSGSESNPTLDFSASPNIAAACIIVFQLSAGEQWDTPTFVTAALSWTTTSTTTNASSTTTVPDGSVVLNVVGFRDDSATLTRGNSGVDAASGVTFNGNYVETPATHHSTTNGNDMAADLGYRLVTTGGSNITLRATGTLSAAETGASLWVLQDSVDEQSSASASSLSSSSTSSVSSSSPSSSSSSTSKSGSSTSSSSPSSVSSSSSSQSSSSESSGVNAIGADAVTMYVSSASSSGTGLDGTNARRALSASN